MKTIFSFLLAFVAFFFACNTSKNTNSEAMKKAFQLHTESSQIEKELTPELETLIQIRNQINIMGRQLTESEMSKVERINQIESIFLKIVYLSLKKLTVSISHMLSSIP